MLVRKFGGTSMGSVAAMRAVAKIIHAYKKPQAVVVSAMSGVTNRLLKMEELALAKKMTAVQKAGRELVELHVQALRELTADAAVIAAVSRYTEKKVAELASFLKALSYLGKVSPRSHDRVLAVGEQLSARLLAGYLAAIGLPAVDVDLEKVISEKFKIADGHFFVQTEKTFGQLFKKVLRRGKLPIGTGYFGAVPGGMLGAVGRGYSDFCAALVAAGLKAEKLEIWTDVSGVLTADPRKVPKAKVVPQISFEAAAELAHFGAKVIHPQSIHPAIRAKIPVWIKNTFVPHDRGTEITDTVKKPKQPITSITSKKGITVVQIASYRMLMQYGYLAKIFEIFAKYQTSIDVVSTSEVSVSLTIEDTRNLDKIIKELTPFAKVSVVPKKAIVCVVGLGMQGQKGIAGSVFTALGQAGISVDQISQGASEINITFIVAEKLADQAVQVLHKKFFS
jgi:aspartate kinase